jgi:transposase
MPTIRRPSPQDGRAALEARRLQAAELFAQGHTQAEVARTLGVSRQSAHLWHTRFQEGGVDALRSRGPTGPDPKMSDAQLAEIEQALLQGAKANGFDADLWTLERVAVVITPADRGPLSPRPCLGDPAPAPWLDPATAPAAGQRTRRGGHRPLGPTRMAQDQKGASAESAWLVFVDESAVSLIPPVRRTWSPRVHTPILRHRFGWKKASMATALGYRHDRTGTMLSMAQA